MATQAGRPATPEDGGQHACCTVVPAPLFAVGDPVELTGPWRGGIAHVIRVRGTPPDPLYDVEFEASESVLMCVPENDLSRTDRLPRHSPAGSDFGTSSAAQRR